MRLDQRIAKFTAYSRNEAKKQIRQGGVYVDGTIETNPAIHVSYEQCIRLHGEILTGQAFVYLMLHKPEGLVSAHRDPEHATVLSLIDLPQKQSLTIAGRLDKDTTGLLLLSDDGQWAHRIMSPRHKQAKVYRVDVANIITAQQVTALENGLLLNGETKPTRPAIVEIINKHCMRLTIYEGKYHQVKRMLAAVGNHVIKLHREQVGSIRLDHQLAVGEWRYLQKDEFTS
ncbi:MAG TPA: 16S rRNA pseudouridine(516) synthase [Thiothrix sp.]|nr:16S rRNA pseudouridine(516) synthase [Thiothrix sp.]